MGFIDNLTSRRHQKLKVKPIGLTVTMGAYFSSDLKFDPCFDGSHQFEERSGHCL